jgi:hypothetical protein
VQFVHYCVTSIFAVYTSHLLLLLACGNKGLDTDLGQEREKICMQAFSVETSWEMGDKRLCDDLNPVCFGLLKKRKLL